MYTTASTGTYNSLIELVLIFVYIMCFFLIDKDLIFDLLTNVMLTGILFKWRKFDNSKGARKQNVYIRWKELRVLSRRVCRCVPTNQYDEKNRLSAFSAAHWTGRTPTRVSWDRPHGRCWIRSQEQALASPEVSADFRSEPSAQHQFCTGLNTVLQHLTQPDWNVFSPRPWNILVSKREINLERNSKIIKDRKIFHLDEIKIFLMKAMHVPNLTQPVLQ